MDAHDLKREMSEEIYPDRITPSKRFKSSESMKLGHPGSASSSSPTMEPSQPSQVDVGHSHPIDLIKSVKKRYQEIDPVDQIDHLIRFIETQLHKMNNPSEAGSSSSQCSLEAIGDGLAAKTIETISTEACQISKEADKLSIWDEVDAIESVTLKVVEGMGDLHSVFVGLFIAAFALEIYMRVSSFENECKMLLLKILELVQYVKQYREQMHNS